MSWFKAARPFARRRKIYKDRAAKWLEHQKNLGGNDEALDRGYEAKIEMFTHSAEAIDYMWWDYKKAMGDD